MPRSQLNFFKKIPLQAVLIIPFVILILIKKAAERAADLTRQILAFSRKQVLEMQTLDLNAVVADFEEMLQRLIGEDIELQTYMAPSLYPVKADKSQLEQVLMNLAVNARDAMPTGGKLTIETANVFLDEAAVEQYRGAQAPGHYVMLTVSDSGHGMNAETRKQLFEPFFTTKALGKGTGLGLATVFGIVKQRQGNIWVYSESGNGTTFKIYLPKINGTPQIADAVSAQAALLHGIETIMVVEDEEIVRKLVCETLAARGYTILEADGPDDSLKQIANYKGKIHLLLTDMITSQMNGRELYQNLRAARPDLKVLYMSGYTDDVVVHHGILDESVNFLQKPFTVHSLIQKVRNVLSE